MHKWEYRRVVVHWKLESEIRDSSNSLSRGKERFVFEYNGKMGYEKEHFDQLLEVLGDQGWELITSMPFTGTAVEAFTHWEFTDTYRYDLVFKRPKQEPQQSTSQPR